MHTKRRPWRPQLTRAEMGRGWVFFALYLTVFPLSMGWVQRAFHGELPVAEANVVYYLLAATLVFLVFWTFLRHGFDPVSYTHLGRHCGPPDSRSLPQNNPPCGSAC